jgi:hypothetical protein
MGHYIRNIVFMWKSEYEFRDLYREQEGFCLPHMADLLELAAKKMSKKEFAEFAQVTGERAEAMHNGVREDLSTFTKSFDYRNADTPITENVKTSVERTALYLSSGKK